MTDYRYRVQVGNEYTYRETGSELDDLIRDLTLGNDVYERLGGFVSKGQGDRPAPKAANSQVRGDQDHRRGIYPSERGEVA